MKIDYVKLRKFLEEHVVPKWQHSDMEWAFRVGGGESYIQDQVVAKGSPYVAKEGIIQGVKDSLLNALKCHVNLLSQYETMFARIFIQKCDEDQLREHAVKLVYGDEELDARLRRFLEWAKVVPIPGENKKKGINAIVTSYLLALSNPRKYTFCKPVAYNAGVTLLMGKENIKTDPVQRILHCIDFYKEILRFLESEYGLEGGNLFDVHSLFYFLQDMLANNKPSTTGKQPSGGNLDLPEAEPQLYEILLERHNVLLYGPPGTGKTREALMLANWWRNKFGDDTVRLVTFHPSYCYEDFIEGFRPDPQNGNFALRDGVFKKFCLRASEISGNGKKFLLFIDEINRGDVARILGETITLIEGDKRGKAYSVTLQQSGDTFCVPENLYLVGTMNTADKSISLMDLAIRRRFMFFPCHPNPDVLDTGKTHFNEIGEVRLSQVLIGMNQRLMNAGIDRDRALGHSYFVIRKDAADPVEVMKNRFRYEIIPLIDEYFYANRSGMTSILGDLVDDFGFVNEDVLEDRERFLEAVRKMRLSDQ